jgi:hypothetical protein
MQRAQIYTSTIKRFTAPVKCTEVYVFMYKSRNYKVPTEVTITFQTG